MGNPSSCSRCNVSKELVLGSGCCFECTNRYQSKTSKKEQVAKEKQDEEESDDMTEVEDEEPTWFLGDLNRDGTIVRRVEMDPELGTKLKPYQREGVEFLWTNCFSDFNLTENGDQSQIGGCILAHYMGLGKSLTTIATLHAALTCDSMVSIVSMSSKKKNKKKKIKKKHLLNTVLLISPANTLTNWVDEVKKWTEDLDNQLTITNLGAITAGSRPKFIRDWKREGGILVLSDSMFLRAANDIIKAGQPDVLVLDEAHTMLKQRGNKGFKKLEDIKTKRRILLTGTPLQNNVSEYYRMVEYIRPGLIGEDTEMKFEKNYRIPIENGLPSDASDNDKLKSMELQSKLQKKLEPHVNRKGPGVLRNILPPIYDVLLELQASLTQINLMRLEKNARKNGQKSGNFFSWYSDIAPLLNHPGTLKLVRAKRGKTITWKSEIEVAGEWFMKAKLSQQHFLTMHEARTSPKLIIIAHIVALASQKGDKTLIYSKDLKTLDIVEWFLSQTDWTKHVDSLKEYNDQFGKPGGWKKGKDYLRIDGSVDSGRRGDLIDKFNSNKDIKAFLISSLAGGIGINLSAASVVVIMDNHFNPSVSSQCISRAHRLGQKKPVYCFRIAIEGTPERKIYAKSVNKEGVATQVVDGKFSESLFTAEEVNDLKDSNIIMTCDKCKKRRLLIDQAPLLEEGRWTCSMNNDKRFNSCGKTMQPKLKKIRRGPTVILNNPILKHIVTVKNKPTRKSPLVIDYIPVQVTHETDLCCEDAIDRMKEQISGVSKSKKKAEKLLLSRDGNEKERSLQHDDSVKKKKAKVSETNPREAAVLYSKYDADHKLDSADIQCKTEEDKKLITNPTAVGSANKFQDIISISSSEEDIHDKGGRPSPQKKVVRPNNQVVLHGRGNNSFCSESVLQLPYFPRDGIRGKIPLKQGQNNHHKMPPGNLNLTMRAPPNFYQDQIRIRDGCNRMNSTPKKRQTRLPDYLARQEPWSHISKS